MNVKEEQKWLENYYLNYMNLNPMLVNSFFKLEHSKEWTKVDVEKFLIKI